MAAAVLSSTLEAIWGATIPAAERRWLANVAVGRVQTTKGAGPRETATVQEVLDDQQLILHGMAVRAGRKSLAISEAKSMLRNAGADQLASRLGKLTKGRNALAHADVGLQQEIFEVMGGGTWGTGREPSPKGTLLAHGFRARAGPAPWPEGRRRLTRWPSEPEREPAGQDHGGENSYGNKGCGGMDHGGKNFYDKHGPDSTVGSLTVDGGGGRRGTSPPSNGGGRLLFWRSRFWREGGWTPSRPKMGPNRPRGSG